MPSHTHAATANVTVNVSDEDGTTAEANGNFLANTVNNNYYPSAGGGSLQGTSATVTNANTGGNQASNIMQPWLGIYHSIALTGVYPSRS